LRFDQVELSAIDRILSRFHWKHCFLVGLGFVMIGVLLQARENIVQLESQLLEARSENDRLKLEASPLESKNSSKAIRPKHPPRLGGTYYRGNDERNPQLFNGGYYRTATFEVTLVDSQGKKIDWGDELPSDGSLIKLDVKRAPYASPQLFSNEAMQNCYLAANAEFENVEAAGKSRNDKIPHSSQAVRLTTVVPNEHWTASYRIVESNDKRNVFKGKLFLTPGTPPPHYGIEYAIKITDGKISEESEIWMGSIYNSGVVVLPNPDRIQLSEWFDFLPIPEITRENSTDPELIGIKPKE
jgi:hypothetical protein